MSQAPRDAETVPVRVQVIDLQPRVVDVVVPTFLNAEDLTQRIARDVGLGAWWEDGTRRTFWLRARGRVLRADERLVDLGVVPYELLHLLPEPPPGAQVQERAPGWSREELVPTSRASRLTRTLAVLAWLALWWVSAQNAPSHGVAWWGAFGLALLLRGAVRGWSARVIVWLELLVVVLAWFVLAAGPLWVLSRVEPLGLPWVLSALVGGVVGHAVAHLVWMGPVEAVEASSGSGARAMATAAVQHSCFVCRDPVATEVLAMCRYGCGRVMHVGCQRAREAASTGSGCEVCGAAVG